MSFTSEGTLDPDGDRIRYAWDFDGDGDIDSNAQDPTHTYRTNGVFRATLTVTDVGGRHRGRHASADVDIVVGNEAPTVELVAAGRRPALRSSATRCSSRSASKTTSRSTATPSP